MRLRGATAKVDQRANTEDQIHQVGSWIYKNNPNPRQTNHDSRRNHAVVNEEGRGWDCLKGKNKLMIFCRLVLHLFSPAMKKKTSTTQARQRWYSSSIRPTECPAGP